MPEHPTDDMEWFRHFHQVTINELELIILKEPIESAEVEPTQNTLVKTHQATLKEILDSFKGEKIEPEFVFQKGLQALSDVEQERFLIENLLETVKRGDSLKTSLEKYRHLGLTDLRVSTDSEATMDNQGNLPSSSVGADRLLQQFLK